MHIIGFRLNDNLEVERYLRRSRKPAPEEQEYTNFPYISYEVDFDIFLEDQAPFHRHREFELLTVTAGTVSVRSSKSSYILREGECCFVNSSTLHTFAPEPVGSRATAVMHLFLPELLIGTWGTVFDSRYVSPVLECRDLDLFYFSRQNEHTGEILGCLQQAVSAAGARELGFELEIRSALSRLWVSLFRDIEPRLLQQRTLSDLSEERMQTMLLFIRKNYASRIGPADIAASAMISERECFRCFRNTLRITPNHYLQRFRIRMAARRLLETDDTIQHISESVGFSDTGYFGRVFHKYMHCTPTEFRRKNQQ